MIRFDSKKKQSTSINFPSSIIPKTAKIGIIHI